MLAKLTPVSVVPRPITYNMNIENIGVTRRKPLLTNVISVNDIDGFGEFGEYYIGLHAVCLLTHQLSTVRGTVK